MPEWSMISLFVAAAFILVIMPGPNTLYIMTRSAQQGLAAGIVSCLGVLVGTLVHVTAAAIGISALLLSSALAFNTVKYAGAAYLVYLGIKTLLAQEKVSAATEPAPEKSLRTAFYQGITVNVLNPKTALFITAFLPQFIDVERGSATAQIFSLGAVLVTIGALSDLTYALLAGKIGDWLRRNVLPLRVQRYLAGGVYLGLGAATALSGMIRK